MIHIAIGFALLSLTGVALTVYSLLSGRDVSALFALGSFVALGVSGAAVAYVLRERL